MLLTVGPDPDLVLVGGGDHDGAFCRKDQFAVQEKHTMGIEVAEILPDGRMLSWSKDTLCLWDMLNGQCIAVLEGHTGMIKGATILPDGRLLSWCWDNDALFLWDAASGNRLAVLEGHTSSIYGVTVLSDRRLLSWSADKTLRLWAMMSGQCLTVLEGHTGSIWNVAVQPDGRLLSWSKDELRLWNGQTGKLINSFPLADGDHMLHLIAFHGVAIRPNENFLINSFNLPDGTLACWSDDALMPQLITTHPDGVVICKTAADELVWLQLYRGSMPLTGTESAT